MVAKLPRQFSSSSRKSLQEFIFLVLVVLFIQQYFLRCAIPTSMHSPPPETTVVRISLCENNPYLAALEPLSIINKKIDDWFLSLNELGAKSLETKMFAHDHERFFPFDELTTCKDKSCVGGKCSDDTSKIICGLNELNKLHERCVVYSLGGNNQWQFELSMLEKTLCEIHTFDCTGPLTRFKVPANDGRLHFHHVCITPYSMNPDDPRPEGMVGESWTLLEMQQKLGHKRIDLLKMDIEGFEFPILSAWPELHYKEESESILLPMQIVMEVHYQTQFLALHPDRGDFKTATNLLELQNHLMRMGYVVTVRDDNPRCLHCTELTLIRARCPNTGVYAAT